MTTTTNSSSDFWLELWQRGDLGFHELTTNEQLIRFWPELNIPDASRVLVPLCGKSLDLMWLRAQGMEVLGIELSQLAVETFFHEQAIEPEISVNGDMRTYTAPGITIICGDFFNLKPENLQDVVAVYDRAALIALSPDARRCYAKVLSNGLPENSKTLLLTLEYDVNEMQGPPFSVSDEEIEGLYSEHFDITLAKEDEQMLEKWPRFKERGLSWMTARTYTLVRRNQ